MTQDTLLTYGGTTQTLRAWAEAQEMPLATLRWRVRHWPLARALTEPVRTCDNTKFLRAVAAYLIKEHQP